MIVSVHMGKFKLSLLEDQSVLLTSELSFQPSRTFFLKARIDYKLFLFLLIILLYL